MPLEVPRPLRFPRSMRLRYGWEFNEVREKGERIVWRSLIFNWMKLSKGSTSRIGIITTKKVGNAAQRSRARRLIREAFRLNQHELNAPVRAVFVARNSIVGLSQQEVNRDYLSALKKAGLYKKAAE